MFESCAVHVRSVPVLVAVFGKFFFDFGVYFCVAGAVFGDVGGWCLTYDAHYFSWQGQHLVRLEGDACCAVHDIISHRSASRDITQNKKSHYMKWRHIKSHHMTWHLATNHISSPRVISQPTRKVWISPGNQPYQKKLPHYNHGMAKHSFTQKIRFRHRSGWSLCAFYGHILFLTRSFFFWKLPPAPCPALLMYK